MKFSDYIYESKLTITLLVIICSLLNRRKENHLNLVKSKFLLLSSISLSAVHDFKNYGASKSSGSSRSLSVSFPTFNFKATISSSVTICLGLIAVIIGLAIFMEGLKTGLMPFGNVIGDTLPKKAPMF